MLKKTLAGLAVAVLLLGPSTVLVGMGGMVSLTTQSYCLAPNAGLVGEVPDSLTATTANGATVTLNRTQLTHARTVLLVGMETEGVTRDGLLIALMAGLTESSLRMLANTGTYPESATFPNDGDGGDHDSLGIFQMRPAAGWGTVADLMDPDYQAAAFFGGPTGPNRGSPRGLLDIPGWESLPLGAAAQAVEVSAFPDRYANYEPVARAILAALTTSAGDAPTSGSGAGEVPETSHVVFPLPEGTWSYTSSFGPRTDPITGEPRFHAGSDFAAPAGTTIVAAADGVVRFAGMNGSTGTITIEHTVDGQKLTTVYLHMYADGINVTSGQVVTAGQPIGQVGSSGHSTGPHLHFEVRPGAAADAAIDPMPWLGEQGADQVEDPGPAAGLCLAA
ncbi:M23 family metallopeptidase [Microbacterium rhizophilus]|uniref:M23 family metallopeptidase n=1 Tax=Microbacterium rhizophilus TaxID=3138934 RepID=UPI0031E7244A